jgi:hypothetical protein
MTDPFIIGFEGRDYTCRAAIPHRIVLEAQLGLSNNVPARDEDAFNRQVELCRRFVLAALDDDSGRQFTEHVDPARFGPLDTLEALEQLEERKNATLALKAFFNAIAERTNPDGTIVG